MAANGLTLLRGKGQLNSQNKLFLSWVFGHDSKRRQDSGLKAVSDVNSVIVAIIVSDERLGGIPKRTNR